MKRATISDAPAVLSLNDKAMWALGFNAALEATFDSPPRYRWDQDLDVLTGPYPDGEWVKWEDVQHLSRPPCTVCGTPYDKHGTYPTCASHPYTPDNMCQHVIGAACVGTECKAGCVHAAGVTPTHEAQQEKP